MLQPFELSGPDICCPMFLNIGSIDIYRYFWSRVNISNVNCTRATTSIIDTRTGVPLKVSMLLTNFIYCWTKYNYVKQNWLSFYKNRLAGQNSILFEYNQFCVRQHSTLFDNHAVLILFSKIKPTPIAADYMYVTCVYRCRSNSGHLRVDTAKTSALLGRFQKFE